MHCYGINIDSLPSTYIYPTSLSIGIDNLGTNCSGSYSYLRKVESFKAIISCKELSLTTRLVIPLAILLNIGCFIWSNSSSTVASVFVVITVGDQIEIAPDALFSFSLVGTVNDMWHARVYPLALLIALFSATWPYLKLLLMLFAWIAPITYLPVHRRDVLLRFLDAFGKWTGLIRVESLVKPFWGFYSFLIATTIEVFNAWAALDVFCLSIIATMLQIQQFALFIVGDSCDKINQILEKYLDSILDGYDTCFDVIATIGKNSYLLFVAAGIVFVVGSISLSVCHVVLQDRKQLIVINDNKHIDDKENNINEPLVNPIDITTTSEQNQIFKSSIRK
eukprot:gene19523-25420_t